MSRRVKRAKAGTSDSHKNKEDSTSGDCPNPLVFDTVIRSLKCPKLLGTCRLVCKSWNESACAVLRELLTLTLSETGLSIKRFKKIMESRKSNVKKHLPQNFSKVRIIVDSLTERPFLAILHNWDADLVVTDLELLEDESIDMDSMMDEYMDMDWMQDEQEPKNLKELHSFLLSHADSLSTLRLQWKHFSTSPEEFDFEEVRLPNLKTLEVALGESSPSFASQLLEAILAKSSLDHLKLLFPGSAPPCLRSLQLENVQTVELYIDVTFLEEDDNPLPTFRNIPLANLKIVKLNVTEDSSPAEVSLVSEVLSQWSESLELIKVGGSKVALDLLPPCPKLKYIMSSDGYSGQFDPDKFPLLKKVSSFTPHAAHEEPSLPHSGVSQLEFIADDGQFQSVFDDYGPGFHKYLCTTLAKFGRQFPNLTDFSCEIRALDEKPLSFSFAVLKAIQSSFLHLKSMRINGHLDLFPKGSRGEPSRKKDTYPTHPLANFQDLESLQLGNDIEVTPALIRHGVGKIPKLKYLNFYTCEDLTAELIQECLGHLVKIEMHSCDYTRKCGSQLSKEEKLKLLQNFPGEIDFLYKCDTPDDRG